MYGKMLLIQFSHNFKKNHRKKTRYSFCGYFNHIKQSGDEKKTMFFVEKNGFHTISRYENCMTSIFSDDDNKNVFDDNKNDDSKK